MNISNPVKRLKTYPYTNARVRAMRSNLVTDSEYRKLQKMELADIAELLSNRGYRQEIEELGAEYSGSELIERALKRNLSNTYMKLLRISPDEVETLLWAYYHKFEIQNLKTILRMQLRPERSDVSETLMPTSTMDQETLQQLQQMDSAEEVLDAFQIAEFEGNLQDRLADADTLQEIEDQLDIYYYEQLQQATERASHSSGLFQEFLTIETALTNINLILRMKRRGYDYDAIADRLIDIPAERQIVNNDELARADSYEDAFEIVQDSEVGQYIDEETPAEIGRALDKYKLNKGIQMLHKDQLSINPILGFMICKEIEVSNLRMITRAKEDELGEEFIERNLITGVSTE